MSLVALKNSLLPSRGYQTLSQSQPAGPVDRQGTVASLIGGTFRSAANLLPDASRSQAEIEDDDEDIESQMTHVHSSTSCASDSGEDCDDSGEEKEEDDDEDGPDSGSSGGSRFRVSARLLSDATIGLSDGLTVPFALTAGLSALGETKVVVFGGLAELIAGAISMGLGGYLGAKSEMSVFPIPSLSYRNPIPAVLTAMGRRLTFLVTEHHTTTSGHAPQPS